MNKVRERFVQNEALLFECQPMTGWFLTIDDTGLPTEELRKITIKSDTGAPTRSGRILDGIE